jgi:hypothetical protein
MDINVERLCVLLYRIVIGYERLSGGGRRMDQVTMKIIKAECRHENIISWMHSKQIAAQIGKSNEEMLRSCDIVLGVMDGTEVDSGTASEIGFAAALGKKCYGLRTDFRDCGEFDGQPFNLQVLYWIELSKEIPDNHHAMFPARGNPNDIGGSEVNFRPPCCHC